MLEVISAIFSAPAPVLVIAGIAGTLGPLGAALALGIRHGMDWDHIAAITDITSTTTASETELREREPERVRQELSQDRYVFAAVEAGGSGAVAYGTGLSIPMERQAPRFAFVRAQKRSLALGTVYAVGHGTMVVLLGLLAILFSEILPTWVDPIMERVVGLTLVFLGLYLLWSLYRFYRHGGEFRIRSRWMLVFSGVKSGWHRLRHSVNPSHQHSHAGADAQQYGVATSYGIGLIHGVGAETGTQVLIIGAAVGATTTGLSVATLFVFVFGLLISNSVITVITAAGFVSAGRRQTIYLVVGAVAAVFSLSLGILYLTESGGVLPDLDPYFRWVGGPS